MSAVVATHPAWSAASSLQAWHARTSGATCPECALRDLCLPLGLSQEKMDEIQRLVSRQFVTRGSSLFRANSPFRSIFAVRTGYFKTSVIADDGRQQVTGFQMSGDVLGFDGIGEGRHRCDAVALEDSEVCLIPYEQMSRICRDTPAVQSQFHRLLSREIVRERSTRVVLGGEMGADGRLAAFLLNLSQRLQARGYSRSEFLLRMTRQDIGACLGLSLESVSRAFSRFARQKLIEVEQRHVRILDELALRLLSQRKLSIRAVDNARPVS